MTSTNEVNVTSASKVTTMTSASDAEMEAAFKRCRYVTEVPGVDTQTVIKEYDRFAVYYDKVSVHPLYFVI